jgi:aspartyl-tRNA(Asn)/glutamyl-tRNA(Gln) amidotransferase subunit A
MSEELAFLSLAEASQGLAEKRFSSVELTRVALARLERIGPLLNAVAALDAEGALKAAQAADSEIAAGRRRGPLHGIPLAHKDMYFRRGRVSGCGSRINARFVPQVTATALERLDAAGALDLGRLNMVEFAYGPTGHNEITGPVRNPWNPAHVTGGSSSGSGSSVAARLVYGALGSDTGGSIRFPAACCGLFGPKPTYGRVSRYGAMPLSFSLDHVGPLARTVTDGALLLQAIAGHDPKDATTRARAVPDYTAGIEGGAKGLRIAVPTNYFYDRIEPEVERLVRASLDLYRKLGAEIVPVEAPGIENANELTSLIIGAEAAAYHSRWLATRRGDYGKQTLSRLLGGLMVPATRYLEAQSLRGVMLKAFVAAVFDRADVLHVPMLPIPVPTIEETDLGAGPGYLELMTLFGRNSRVFNYLGLPAFSVPCGFTAGGLPASFQLVGRPFAEAQLFRAARAYERETAWSKTAPPEAGAAGGR